MLPQSIIFLHKDPSHSFLADTDPHIRASLPLVHTGWHTALGLLGGRGMVLMDPSAPGGTGILERQEMEVPRSPACKEGVGKPAVV